MAQWVRLRLPTFTSCGPKFKSQAHHLRFFLKKQNKKTYWVLVHSYLYGKNEDRVEKVAPPTNCLYSIPIGSKLPHALGYDFLWVLLEWRRHLGPIFPNFISHTYHLIWAFYADAIFMWSILWSIWLQPMDYLKLGIQFMTNLVTSKISFVELVPGIVSTILMLHSS